MPSPSLDPQLEKLRRKQTLLTATWAVAGALALLSAAAFTYQWRETRKANFNGICSETGRKLTRDELARSAVAQTLMGHPMGAGPSGERSQVIPIDTVDEFLLNNPDCCYVGFALGEGATLSHRLRRGGDAAAFVTVNGTFHFRLNADGKTASEGDILTSDVSTWYVVKNCGEAYRRDLAVLQN